MSTGPENKTHTVTLGKLLGKGNRIGYNTGLLVRLIANVQLDVYRFHWLTKLSTGGRSPAAQIRWWLETLTLLLRALSERLHPEVVPLPVELRWRPS